MSDAVVWRVLLKNNSKALKRTHPVTRTTLEKGSLRNTRHEKDSGYACTSAVDVSANDDGIPVISFRNRNPSAQRHPDKMWRAVTLNGGVRKAISKAGNMLSSYKPAVRKAALAKVSAVYHAHVRKNHGVDHTSLVVSQ